jgi:hypothetical protein
MEYQGGSVTATFGRPVLEFWGNETDSLQWSGWRPDQSGKYLFQLNASNGQGALNTGVTCGLKLMEVFEDATGKRVSAGYLMMPHTGSWSEFRPSSFLAATLQKGTAYRVVVRQDDRAINMSHFRHFERYGGVGGREGPSNRVNVASIKVLYRGP